ncbi:MAG: hypothetical protein VR65_20150 [Desulfobulbaceae bacterium BRH_c16a]|nr:MAG: hypothetical protein VR65_20150 [Desulfobulbaceae bacterium BRH_c16a]
MTLTRRLHYWATQLFAPNRLLTRKYTAFKELLRHDKRSLELISDLEDIRHSGTLVDTAAVARLTGALSWSVGSLIRSLSSMHPGFYRDLEQRFFELEKALSATLPAFDENRDPPYTLSLIEAADRPALAGGKAHALGRVLQATDLPLPRGFVITTNAFNLFLAHNDLRHRLDELLAEVRFDEGDKRLRELSGEMTGLIRQAEVPEVLVDDIRQRLAELRRLPCSGPWALRSSAVSEDGENSFAGQYTSILGVDDEDIPAAYMDIIAGKYTPHAITYRVRCGLADQEAGMAVILMEMIETRFSGVMYSRDVMPGEPSSGCLAVYAVAGQGSSLVDGTKEPSVYRFTREKQDRPAPVQEDSAVPEVNSLAPATAAMLAGWGMRLEQLFGSPQDIEWCEDMQGSCRILQCRPLQMTIDDCPAGTEAPEAPDPSRTILLSGGVTASAGVGTGGIFILQNDTQLADVPNGAVLVTATLPPVLAGILERLRAVVAEGGSRASHFASVARESGLPVISGMHGAMQKLTAGSIVTVDAGRNEVYSGTPWSNGHEKSSGIAWNTPFMNRLAALMELVSPLHLLDPASPEFSPRYCGSMHDLVRFAHEKGMAEMFSLVGPSGREMTGTRQLVGELPLTMNILDLGGGIVPEESQKKVVGPEQIASPLMRACWEGLSDPQVTWDRGLAILDWEQADRHSGGIMSLKSAALGSYAVLARDYLHLVLRFGYHFAVLDTLGGEDPEANYIAFRFKGGGGQYENRLLRVKLIERILAWAGFTVRTKGDLLDARFERRPVDQIISRLTLLGILQGKCRMLDMALTEDGQIDTMTESFKAMLQHYVDPSKRREQ